MITCGNYMVHLYQRKMIAEINCSYNVDFVLMDGIKAFVTGGPDKGIVG